MKIIKSQNQWYNIWLKIYDTIHSLKKANQHKCNKQRWKSKSKVKINSSSFKMCKTCMKTLMKILESTQFEKKWTNVINNYETTEINNSIAFS